MFAVVGGGAAGCAAAYVLTQAGHETVLLEASGSLGGRARTVQRDGFGVEVGAIFMVNTYAKTIELLKDSGARDMLKPWSPLAGLWDGNILHPVRYDYIPSVLKLPMLSLRDKLRLTARAGQAIFNPAPEPFETDSLAQFDQGENAEEWSRRRLGDKPFEYVIRPLIEASFGTDCCDLSVAYLQAMLKRAHRVKYFLPRDGMSGVCTALTRRTDVRVATEVTAIERHRDDVVVVTADDATQRVDGVVIATDARCAAGILKNVVQPNTLRTLNSAPYASMAHVNLRWSCNPWPDNKFEILLPAGPGPRALLATIVTRSETSQLVPPGSCMTNSYFSSKATQEFSSQELIETAVRHVADTLGKGSAEPEAEVFSFERALAISPPGHYRSMKNLRDMLPAKIAIAGDYLTHLGVEAAVSSGARAARRLVSTSNYHRLGRG
jgi:protoporphyrinogen/coproporphyrinogen III oxidase